MEIRSQIEAILQGENSDKDLYEMVKQLIAECHPKEVLLKQFEELHLDLMPAGKEKEDDIILDIMDYLAGWCSPHMKL